MDQDLSVFQEKLGYQFGDLKGLHEALRHSSYVNEINEYGLTDNERLEFLGDAVLDLAISHMLIKYYGNVNEGDLSRMRANLVNEQSLAKLAKKISLGDFLILGKGESLSGGREKSSILADAFEAVLAAIYLDAGFSKVFIVIEKHFGQLIESAREPFLNLDYKSTLQERAQAMFKETPVYHVIEESGPDHDKRFTVEITINGKPATGTGRSKKSAEQAAAKNALEICW